MPLCQQKNGCALSALDGNGGGKPRALPWAVMWRPFRPWIRTAMLEEESHGFSLAVTAQGLRYGRLGSLRYLGGQGHGWFYYEISGLTTKLWTPALRDPRAEARVGAVDEASTAAREGACAPQDQPRSEWPQPVSTANGEESGKSEKCRDRQRVGKATSGEICSCWWQARRARSDAPYHAGRAAGLFDFMAHFGVRV